MPRVNLKSPFEAYNGEEPYIFIAYSHRDAGQVYPELERLHNAGYRIWYDEGIDPGQEWPEDVAKALKKCAFFLVFISPNAVESTNVRNEIYFALNHQKQLLGIYLEETQLPSGLELRIGALQAILQYSMSDQIYWSKLIKSLPEDVKEITLPEQGEYASNEGLSNRLNRKNIKNGSKWYSDSLWWKWIGGTVFLFALVFIIFIIRNPPPGTAAIASTTLPAKQSTLTPGIESITPTTVSVDSPVFTLTNEPLPKPTPIDTATVFPSTAKTVIPKPILMLTETPIKPSPAITSTKTLTTATMPFYLRTGPSVEMREGGKCPKGSEVEIISTEPQRQWFYIRCQSYEGWANEQWISRTFDVKLLPIADHIPATPAVPLINNPTPSKGGGGGSGGGNGCAGCSG